jgi:hypothetical protein
MRLSAVLRYSGAVAADSVTRTIGPDDAWSRFTANQENPFPPEESVGNGLDLFSLPSLYRAGTCLRVTLAPCPLGQKVHKAILTRIDGFIRGTFCPSEVMLAIGDHDLFEFAENEDGLLFARATFSVAFWGYSSPLDWVAFRDEVFALPEVGEIKRDLGGLVGPLQECAYWNV